LPGDTVDCTSDLFCPSGTFCELFTGTCQTGCRDDVDCQGQCGGGTTTCACNGEHVCAGKTVGAVGDECDANEDCPGGTVCAVNSPNALEALPCQLGNLGGGIPGGGAGGIPGGGAGGFPLPGCDKSCKVACDLLSSQISDPCPSGEQCGSGDLFMDLIGAVFTGAIPTGGTETNASICYPK